MKRKEKKKKKKKKKEKKKRKNRGRLTPARRVTHAGKNKAMDKVIQHVTRKGPRRKILRAVEDRNDLHMAFTMKDTFTTQGQTQNSVLSKMACECFRNDGRDRDKTARLDLYCRLRLKS